MFCPRCGQQQVSDEMRFCSRCGLPIGGLIEWLGRAGVPAAPPSAPETPSAQLSPRRKGIRRGGKVMFASAVLFVIFLIISIAVDEGGPLVIPFFVFFVGLVMMLYARLFSSPVPRVKTQYAPPSLVQPSTNALPPHTHVPMHDIAQQRGKTNELAHQPSVTEHTTKLLDHNQ